MSSSQRPLRQAFTLIELPVVIAVIAILAAMLLLQRNLRLLLLLYWMTPLIRAGKAWLASWAGKPH